LRPKAVHGIIHARQHMYRRLLLDEQAGQDVIEYSLLIALIVILGAAAFPFSTNSMAAICAKADMYLNRAMQTSWQ
jgi:hypothetical protein